MTLIISIIFILSSNVLIFNLPSSDGLSSNKGYHVSSINDVLTPSERLMYVTFGTLPSRIYYSQEKHCYVVRGQAGYYNNDLQRKEGNRIAVPRWKYYLNQLSPTNLIESGAELLSIGKGLVGLGEGSGNHNDDDDYYDALGDEDGGADDGTDGDADDGADGGADDGADGDADDVADGNANNDKGTEKETGLLSNGLNMGKNMISPLFNLIGGSKDENNNNNNDKKVDKNDKKDEENIDNKDNEKDDKSADSINYMGLAKDALQSDLAKDAVRTGISLFVPGAPVFLAAMDAASKYNKADETIDKVGDKIPKFK